MISSSRAHRWALWYLWNPWIMPVRGTPCTGTCDRPVGTLWVIEPCTYPVCVSVFSQSSCRAVLCLGVLPHACTLSKCAPLDYTQVCVTLDFLCRCKRLHAVSPLWDCSGQYFTISPPCVYAVRVGTCIICILYTNGKPQKKSYLIILFSPRVVQTILCT